VSANAIADTLETYYPEEVEVIRSRVFEETNNPILLHHEEFLVDQVKHFYRNRTYQPFLFFCQKLRPMTSLKLVHNTVFRREKRACIDLMMSYHPDAIISTHYSPLHFSVEAKRKRGADFLAMAYNPDPCVHAWWDNRADLLVVNNDRAYAEAREKRGFPAGHVFSGKFLLRAAVRDTVPDRAALRARFGLDPDRFTVVIADGAYAAANLVHYTDRLLEIRKPFTLLVVAGKNDEVYDRYTARIGENPMCDLRVYRFMENVHELYGAADLFVTKAGPNAMLDSAFMETPILTNYYCGHIEKDSERLFVEDCKIGVAEHNADAAAAWISSLIDDPTPLAAYRENCRRFKENNRDVKPIADRIIHELRERDKRRAAPRRR